MSDSQRIPAPVPVEYPSSDGQPMAETSVHRRCIIDTIGGLHECFDGRPDVYVSGDMFVYYEEGNPRASVVPDVFVVVGAVKDELREGGWRDTYKLWEEPKGPDFVLEVTSRSTRRDDQVRKRALYARLGVSEYFLFDPKGEYLVPSLQGMCLRRSGYEPMAPERVGDGMEGVWSEALGCICAAAGRRCVCTIRLPVECSSHTVKRRRPAGKKQQPVAPPRHVSPSWKRFCLREAFRCRRKSDGPERVLRLGLVACLPDAFTVTSPPTRHVGGGFSCPSPARKRSPSPVWSSSWVSHRRPDRHHRRYPPCCRTQARRRGAQEPAGVGGALHREAITTKWPLSLVNLPRHGSGPSSSLTILRPRTSTISGDVVARHPGLHAVDRLDGRTDGGSPESDNPMQVSSFCTVTRTARADRRSEHPSSMSMLT